jgi:AMMECR1 domain-containing protein
MDWEVGKHGIEIEFTKHKRRYSSTFLPEVMEDWKWSKEETYKELLQKAGYGGSLESVLSEPTLKITKYQSWKDKMSYPQYVEFKEKSGN